ncbi:MAG TPA: SoxR reducing system RseC family protein [Candidatus Tripitaka californicus]|uniref:SoxR reducing system RseC family protein n=1 Tax=Candidatus Tripitaka californicus TaxID=3367616 RepID=UPI00402A37C3
MIQEEGIVTAVHNGKATIEINKTAAEACARCGVCISAGDVKRLLEIQTIAGLSAGNKVILKIGTPSAYKGIALLLLFPLLAFFFGCIVGEKVTFILPESTNLRMGIFGLLSFSISLLGASLYDKRLRAKGFRPPVIVSGEGERPEDAEG